MFDFDGVLVDTLGICHALDAELNEGISLEEYRKYFDGNVFDSTNEHIKNGTRSFHPIAVFDAKYGNETRKIKIPEDIQLLVKRLTEESMLAIVSSSPSEAIGKIIERESVSGCFTDIMGSDIHTSKVVKIRMLLEKYGKYNRETIFVTDTVGDIKEAHECGVSTIAVTWGFHERERLEKMQPFAIVDTVPELAAAIVKFFATI